MSSISAIGICDMPEARSSHLPQPRAAAFTLAAEHDQAANVSDLIRLLADCRTAFGDTDALPPPP